VESVEGRGSVVHVYLPFIEQGDVIPSLQSEQELCIGHGEMILLVDDEQHILETGKEVLETLGYRVLTASNGQQAVDIFETHVEAIDLCLFDIVMPVMGGDQAAQLIRDIKPDMKIIFSTGYDKNLDISMEHEVVLAKPFSIAEMSRVIQQQLQAG